MAFLNETGLQKLWEQIDDKFARITEVDEIVSKKPGRLVEGEELTYIDSEGVETTAVAGVGAEIFNDLTTNVAIGGYSHAEGMGTIAYGRGSHAEGEDTKTYGSLSHAEGYETIAHGHMSHAEGDNTIAYGYTGSDRYIPQHVQGAYNIEDTEERYIHIVGNGQHDIPSNAHTIDGYGNTWYAGNLYLGGTSMDDATIKGFIVHNSTTDLPAVINGAILIAFDA